MNSIKFYADKESFYFGNMSSIKRLFIKLANEYVKDYFGDVFISYGQLEKFYQKDLLDTSLGFHCVYISFHDCGSDFWTNTTDDELYDIYRNRCKSHHGATLCLSFDLIDRENLKYDLVISMEDECNDPIPLNFYDKERYNNA